MTSRVGQLACKYQQVSQIRKTWIMFSLPLFLENSLTSQKLPNFSLDESADTSGAPATSQVHSPLLLGSPGPEETGSPCPPPPDLWLPDQCGRLLGLPTSQ